MPPPPPTEPSILTSYLLPPSPLPTLLPYSSFLTLVPSSYRTNPAYSRSLRTLYRDLQFQRALDVETVRDAIERECARAPTLKAGLVRRIAREEAGGGRKRKWKEEEGEGSESGDSLFDAGEVRVEEMIEDLAGEGDHEGPVSRISQRQWRDLDEVFAAQPGVLHPAAHVLPSAQGVSARGTLHTDASLVEAMQTATRSLERQIEEAEEECQRVLEEMRETVGGLSDLRYGKFGRGSDATTGLGRREEEIVEALGELRKVVREKNST